MTNATKTKVQQDERQSSIAELDRAIASLDTEIDDLQTALQNFILQDEAEERGITIEPKDSSLFSQITAQIERTRLERSQEEAAEERKQLWQTTAALLATKQGNRLELVKQKDSIELSLGVDREVAELDALIQRYNEAAKDLAALGLDLKSHPRQFVGRKNGTGPYSAELIRGCPIGMTATREGLATVFSQERI